MSDPSPNPAAAAARGKGSWQLRLMLLVTVLPLLAAYIAYYTGWGVPDDTVNHGQLLTPVADIKPLLAETSGSPSWTDHTLWHLVLPVAGNCVDDCARNLYTSRQVHIRLGEKSERVERMALALDAEAEAYLASVAAEHPTLQVLPVDAAAWHAWQRALPGVDEVTAERFFLIDPQGFAMLAYTAGESGNDLLKDLKRILRFSPEE